MPTERTSVCVDVCPEATPSDSWGGGASLSETPHKLCLLRFASPLLHPGQGAGPGGGSHWRGPARRPLPGKAQGPSGVGRRR